MNPDPLIRHLPHTGIDLRKWDHCISAAPNGLIYAYSWYLSEMAPNWDGLVLGDYEAVMPLPWNRKYGFYYLYQPFLCASLGLFGNNIDAGLLRRFFEAVPRRYKLWDMYLNYGNFISVPGYDLYQRISHVLDLNPSYEALYEGFRTSYKTLLKRFDKLGYSVQKNVPIADVLKLTKEKLVPVANVKETDYENFHRLYDRLYSEGRALNYGGYSPKGDLLASAVFLFSHKRAYYIVAGNHADGRTVGASHQVINAFIRDHAGQELLLDFEGSDVHNIAFFFKSSGAQEERYPGLFYNRLPPLLRWLKTRS